MIDGSKNDIKNQKRTSLKNVKVSAGGADAPPAFCSSWWGCVRAKKNEQMPSYMVFRALSYLFRNTVA